MSLRLLSAGSNASNQLAHSGEEDSSRFQPCTTPGSFEGVQGLAFGANHTVGLFVSDGRAVEQGLAGCQIWGCGDGRFGQLGADWQKQDDGFKPLSLPRAPLPGDWVPTHVACSWTTTFIAFKPRTDLDAPPDHPSMALLLALGSNDFSELGAGVRGQVGVAVHRTHWHVFKGEFIVDVKAGPRHVAVTLKGQDGRWRVLGWGAARHGQLAPVAEVPKPLKYPVTVDSPTLILPSATETTMPADSVQLALGFAHTALHSPSANILHLLGAPTNPAFSPLSASVAPATSVHSTWHHLINLEQRNILRVQGRPSSLGAAGPLHALPVELVVTAVAPGSEHILLLTSSHEVWGWGWNEHGNLGDGTLEDVEVPKRLWTEGEGKVYAVWAGCGTSWILVKG